MSKFVINVGGKIHHKEESGPLDPNKFQINEKGKEQQQKPEQKPEQKPGQQQK